MSVCKVCLEKVDQAVAFYWQCADCKANVHDSCVELDVSPSLKGNGLSSIHMLMHM